MLYRVTELLNSSIYAFSGLIYVFYVDLFNLHFKALGNVLEKEFSDLIAIKPVKTVNGRIEFLNFGTIKTIHLSLCEIHDKINDCVGKVVAFFFFHSTFQLIQHGYSCFLAVVTHDISPEFFHRLFGIAFRLTFVVLVVSVSEKHRREVLL